ncbi:GxxExxY protein [Panacibacter ginsenosidivorans]|uniref:GxxExxY protein n=1 Tax=Panacibacter ginsenosidivorans TaxID=1813871 RepID=A0A5B8V912_9BACT|nr:GxxExxY protein [Panacibacter ginsenosidivorans]QEC67904.1 GxxExxY protein [Panacibacter ginsenosidivorans]
MSPETANNNDYPLQELTSRIIGLGIEIHKTLGAGFLEIVYKDAFEYEFTVNQILFAREEELKISYKTTILKHTFYADFIVFDNVILEIKAKEGGIAEEDYAQTINYLKCSGCKIGLILNFAKLKLEIKRVIY